MDESNSQDNVSKEIEVTFTDKNFEEEALQKDSGVVLVDFWAPWCGPCKMQGPIVEKIAENFDGKAKVGKLNVDENLETARKYGVSSIPTIKIFKNGEEVDSVTGLKNEEELTDILNKHLESNDN